MQGKVQERVAGVGWLKEREDNMIRMLWLELSVRRSRREAKWRLVDVVKLISDERGN